ncbi:MAG: hypothetical protein AAFV29_09115, partial [Myxococcota bacterium]
MHDLTAQERPWRVVVWATVCASLATAGVLYMLRTAPVFTLIGRSGQHERPVQRLAECLDCHVPFVGTPASRCLSPGCHGALATGTPPTDGPAMPVRFHVALRDLTCGRCHEEHRPSPERRQFDHRIIPTAARTDCRRCHHAAQPAHASGDTVACGRCHTYSAWAGIQIEHQRVADEACDVCHKAPENRRHAAVAGTCDG